MSEKTFRLFPDEARKALLEGKTLIARSTVAFPTYPRRVRLTGSTLVVTYPEGFLEDSLNNALGLLLDEFSIEDDAQEDTPDLAALEGADPSVLIEREAQNA